MGVVGTCARILLAVVLTCAVSALYYNPELNPLAKKWMELTHPSGVSEADKNLHVTMYVWIACAMNAMIGIFMAMMMYFSSDCCWCTSALYGIACTVGTTIPHVLYDKQDMTVAAIDLGQSALCIFIIALCLGFKRQCPAPKTKRQ